MDHDYIPPPEDNWSDDDVLQPPSPKRKPRGGRQVPHNLEAEQATLGALLMSPATVAEIVFDVVKPGDFFTTAHTYIAHAVSNLIAADASVDVITVAEHLRTVGHLEEIGGPVYLNELLNATPSTSNAAAYAEAVANTATLRRLILSASQITEKAFGATSPLEALEAANTLLEQIGKSQDVMNVSSLDVGDFDALLANGMKPPEADMLRRVDGGCLFYAGKMHTLQAEPSSGKTWITLYAAIEILEMGGAVLFIDYEDTALTIFMRLLALGAKAEDIRARFRYLNPSGAMGVAERSQLNRIAEEINPDLVIIDGVAAALSREGLSEDIASDVVTWYNDIPLSFARGGAAVVTIDHLVKDKEQQGRYSRGSGAKLAVLDGAAYSVRIITPFTRSKAGSVRLTVAKDKPGGVGAIGDHVAHFSMEPHADGERVVASLAGAPAAAESAPDGTWQPTTTMARVMRAVGESELPMTAAAIRRLIPGKGKVVSTAIQRLLTDGYLTEQHNGGKKVLIIVKPYSDPAAKSPLTPPPASDADQHEQTELPLPTDSELDDLIGPPPWETNPEDF